MRLLLGSGLLLLLFAGCSGRTDTTIDVADYSRSCAANQDCALAIDGDVCAVCPNSAVARSDARYGTDRARIAGSCKHGGFGSGDCTSARAVCTGGACAILLCEGPNASACPAE